MPLVAAGCRMDSKAKNNPAMGAPNPAEMPAAEPAAMRPRRREDAAAAAADAVDDDEEEEVVLVVVVVVVVEMEVAMELCSPAAALATEAPIPQGPSGPSDAPDPRVTTAAAALSTGFALDALSVTGRNHPGVLIDDPGARSRPRIHSRNLSPVTRNPAAVGAATALAACSHDDPARPLARLRIEHVG